MQRTLHAEKGINEWHKYQGYMETWHPEGDVIASEDSDKDVSSWICMTRTILIGNTALGWFGDLFRGVMAMQRLSE